MRPRHDGLTPREREVLALIRLGLTNEEIATRLDISVSGAKYHVSQILSKLGVATREEATALAVGERRRCWAAPPLWAKIAGAATVLAAVAGLAVLAWGVMRTADTSEDGSPTAGSGEPPGILFRVEGAGMEPTYSNGEFVFAREYGDAEPQRGDVIVFHGPVRPDRDFIKRIIGLPGDRIEINESSDEVLVNGTPLAEPYATKPTACFNACFVSIPVDNSDESSTACASSACYFVVGDNRQNSSDSRQGWLVPAGNILGWVDVE
jgi:signal peptidase I